LKPPFLFRSIALKKLPDPDKPEKYPKQFATKAQRYFSIFLRALVSWWQDEKSFAIINTNSRIKIS
jgi:hypothetical protein